MGFNTDRLGLRIPDYTDPEAVITDVNNNFDKIDDAINANIFTSSTRPANPYHGRLIYESDTRLLALFLKDTGWTYVGGYGFARGKMAVITADGDSALSTTTEIGPFISVTFTAENGRRYWVETTYNIGFLGTGNNASGKPRVRWAAGATVTTAGTQLGSDIFGNVFYGQGGPRDYWAQYEFAPGVSGTITVGLFLLSGDSSKQMFFDEDTDRSAFLIVRDVGAT